MVGQGFPRRREGLIAGPRRTQSEVRAATPINAQESREVPGKLPGVHGQAVVLVLDFGSQATQVAEEHYLSGVEKGHFAMSYRYPLRLTAGHGACSELNRDSAPGQGVASRYEWHRHLRRS